jgi:hypothetical protein
MISPLLCKHTISLPGYFQTAGVLTLFQWRRAGKSTLFFSLPVSALGFFYGTCSIDTKILLFPSSEKDHYQPVL